MSRYCLIIPTYNSAPTLRELLDSLTKQTFETFDVIVVDDCSTDDTKSLVGEYPFRYECMAENGGPAAARNHGASLTEAEWLVFTDADTVWTPETMQQIHDTLQRADAEAMVGSYSGNPANDGFVPRYKALWEYHIVDSRCDLSREDTYPINSWAPRPGLIRRDIFEQLGGFNTGFTGADLEDVELGYRMVDEGYRIAFAPHIRIAHHYPETIAGELKPFARRAAIWMRMGAKRRKLDSNGESSPDTAIAHLCGFGAPFAFLSGILWPPLALSGLILLLIFVILNGRFLAAAIRTGGVGFGLAAAAYCWVHSIVLGFAAAYGLITLQRGV